MMFEWLKTKTSDGGEGHDVWMLMDWLIRWVFEWQRELPKVLEQDCTSTKKVAYLNRTDAESQKIKFDSCKDAVCPKMVLFKLFVPVKNSTNTLETLSLGPVRANGPLCCMHYMQYTVWIVLYGFPVCFSSLFCHSTARMCIRSNEQTWDKILLWLFKS